MADIAILDDVLLAFESDPSLLLRSYHVPGPNQVLKGNDFGPNKASLYVGMDDTSGFNGDRALANRPGPYLILAHSEKTDQAQQGIR